MAAAFVLVVAAVLWGVLSPPGDSPGATDVSAENDNDRRERGPDRSSGGEIVAPSVPTSPPEDEPPHELERPEDLLLVRVLVGDSDIVVEDARVAITARPGQEPLEGATRGVGRGTTDEAGTTVVPVSANVEYLVTVTPSASDRQRLGEAELTLSAASRTAVDVRLPVRGDVVRVAGRVVDTLGGPVSGAWLLLRKRIGAGFHLARSRESGDFTFIVPAHAAPAEELSLSACALGHGAFAINLDADGATGVEVVLPDSPGTSALVVRALLPDGGVAQGVSSWLHTDVANADPSLRDAGVERFFGLLDTLGIRTGEPWRGRLVFPALSPGEYRLELAANGHYFDGRVEVGADLTELELTLTPGRTVRGRVVLSHASESQVHAQLHLPDAKAMAEGPTLTISPGSTSADFSMNGVPLGAHRLLVRGRGRAYAETLVAKASEAGSVTVVEDLVLPVGSTVSGVVLAEDGSHVASGAVVHIYTRFGWNHCMIGAEGRFSISEVVDPDPRRVLVRVGSKSFRPVEFPESDSQNWEIRLRGFESEVHRISYESGSLPEQRTE